MADPHGLPEKTIFEEFPDWHIAPIEVGWAATRTARDGHNIHTVGAPTVHELRLRLREVSGRVSRPRPFLEAS